MKTVNCGPGVLLMGYGAEGWFWDPQMPAEEFTDWHALQTEDSLDSFWKEPELLPGVVQYFNVYDDDVVESWKSARARFVAYLGTDEHGVVTLKLKFGGEA